MASLLRGDCTLGLPKGALETPRVQPHLSWITSERFRVGEVKFQGQNLCGSQVIPLCSWVRNSCVKMACLPVTCSDRILTPKGKSKEIRKGPKRG